MLVAKDLAPLVKATNDQTKIIKKSLDDIAKAMAKMNTILSEIIQERGEEIGQIIRTPPPEEAPTEEKTDE